MAARAAAMLDDPFHARHFPFHLGADRHAPRLDPGTSRLADDIAPAAALVLGATGFAALAATRNANLLAFVVPADLGDLPFDLLWHADRLADRRATAAITTARVRAGRRAGCQLDNGPTM